MLRCAVLRFVGTARRDACLPAPPPPPPPPTHPSRHRAPRHQAAELHPVGEGPVHQADRLWRGGRPARRWVAPLGCARAFRPRGSHSAVNPGGPPRHTCAVPLHGAAQLALRHPAPISACRCARFLPLPGHERPPSPSLPPSRQCCVRQPPPPTHPPSPCPCPGINYVPNQYLLDPRYAPPQQYIMSKQTPR